jgi:hypothetical protein
MTEEQLVLSGSMAVQSNIRILNALYLGEDNIIKTIDVLINLGYEIVEILDSENEERVVGIQVFTGESWSSGYIGDFMVFDRNGNIVFCSPAIFEVLFSVINN